MKLFNYIMTNISFQDSNSIVNWGRNCLRYTKACAYGLYQRATKQPTPTLVEQVTHHFTLTADPANITSGKNITYEAVDFSKRSYSLFPTVRRAHIISNRELMKAGWVIPREGEAFRSGAHAVFDDLMGSHNMLLHPNHARLRRPLEHIFSAHSSRSYELFEKIWETARVCYSKSRKEKTDVFNSIPYFVSSILFKTLLGLEPSKEANDILILINNQNEIPVTELKRNLSECFCRIFENQLFKPDCVLDILHKDKTLSEEEKISTAIMLIFAATHSSVNFLQLYMSALKNRPNLIYKMNQEWHSMANLETLDMPTAMHEFVTHSKWMEACYAEVSRLYPIFAGISRIAKKDMQIGDLHVAAGDEVHFNVLGSQRTEEWGEDPTAFRPERFIENPLDAAKLLTFGAGRQQCLGKFFAKTEIKTFALFFVAMMAPFQTAKQNALFPPKELNVEVTAIGRDYCEQPIYSTGLKKS
jgi:hypothetical protein